MFLSIVLTVTAACPIPKIENKSGDPWNDFDYKTFLKVQRRCGQIYKRSPCVKKFIKRTERDYSVICGGGVVEGPGLLSFPKKDNSTSKTEENSCE